MEELLWLIPALPFAGSLLLILFGTRMSRMAASIVGAGSVGLSAGLTAIIGLLLGSRFISASPALLSYQQLLWTWFDVAGFTPSIAFHVRSEEHTSELQSRQ